MQRRDFVQGLALLPLANSAFAQGSGWPQRPVHWILSQPAGSGPDILARFVADQLTHGWKQPVVIDNKPGGQNVIGAVAAARAAADGYTFYFATTAAMVTNLYTFKSLPYDPVKGFDPIRLVGRSPFVIACNPAFPAKDLAEAIAKAKAQPGTVSIATEGPKTFSGMLAENVAALGGVKFNHVPYSKAPDALQDAAAGRVQLVCLPNAALKGYLQAGRLRPLAISTSRRQAELPEVPAIAETFPGFEFTGWNGLFAPAGTPPEIVARVNRDLDAVLSQPEVARRMLALGSVAEPSMSVAEFASFMQGERERWGNVVKSIGIQPE